MYLFLFFLFVLGASLAMWPEQFGPLSKTAARRRLKEIDGGAAERNFLKSGGCFRSCSPTRDIGYYGAFLALPSQPQRLF